MNQSVQYLGIPTTLHSLSNSVHDRWMFWIRQGLGMTSGTNMAKHGIRSIQVGIAFILLCHIGITFIIIRQVVITFILLCQVGIIFIIIRQVGITFILLCHIGITFIIIRQVGITFILLCQVGIIFSLLCQVGIIFIPLFQVGITFSLLCQVGITFILLFQEGITFILLWKVRITFMFLFQLIIHSPYPGLNDNHSLFLFPSSGMSIIHSCILHYIKMGLVLIPFFKRNEHNSFLHLASYPHGVSSHSFLRRVFAS